MNNKRSSSTSGSLNSSARVLNYATYTITDSSTQCILEDYLIPSTAKKAEYMLMLASFKKAKDNVKVI